MNECLTDAYCWSSAHRSHIGKVRKLNEDSVLDQPRNRVWVVADGMGGHAAGERASGLVVDALADLTAPSRLEEFVAEAIVKIEAVNAQLRDESARAGGAVISGTTVAAMLVHGRKGAAVWAGDSRVYLYRNNTLHALSRDHSQVEEWVANGLLERDSADDHPAANVITRAVGAADTIEPETTWFEVLPGDIYLLCSDGLHNEVRDEAIAQVLDERDCERCAGQLLSAALAGDARDNISLIVARADTLQTDSTKTVINPAFWQRG